jgi:hypothetical protein
MGCVINGVGWRWATREIDEIKPTIRIGSFHFTAVAFALPTTG